MFYILLVLHLDLTHVVNTLCLAKSQYCSVDFDGLLLSLRLVDAAVPNCLSIPPVLESKHRCHGSSDQCGSDRFAPLWMRDILDALVKYEKCLHVNPNLQNDTKEWELDKLGCNLVRVPTTIHQLEMGIKVEFLVLEHGGANAQ